MSDPEKTLEVVPQAPPAGSVPKEVSAPKELPDTLFEYGARLNAVYKAGWEDCRAMMEKIYSQKAETDKNQKSFWKS